MPKKEPESEDSPDKKRSTFANVTGALSRRLSGRFESKSSQQQNTAIFEPHPDVVKAYQNQFPFVAKQDIEEYLRKNDASIKEWEKVRKTNPAEAERIQKEDRKGIEDLTAKNNENRDSRRNKF